jgi:hypothetical protein
VFWSRAASVRFAEACTSRRAERMHVGYGY